MNTIGKYKILALEKSVSQQLIDVLKGPFAGRAARQPLPPKEWQGALERFVKERNLTGDDLSDLLYDLERAGFHNLKKPDIKPVDKKRLKQLPHRGYFKGNDDEIAYSLSHHPKDSTDSYVDDAIWLHSGKELTDKELEELTEELYEKGDLYEMWREWKYENP